MKTAELEVQYNNEHMCMAASDEVSYFRFLDLDFFWPLVIFFQNWYTSFGRLLRSRPLEVFFMGKMFHRYLYINNTKVKAKVYRSYNDLLHLRWQEQEEVGDPLVLICVFHTEVVQSTEMNGECCDELSPITLQQGNALQNHKDFVKALAC